jgi:cell division protein FtsQ
MAKKLVKKKKLKVVKLLVLLLILSTIVFFVYLYLKSSVRNIIIKGNTYLNDEEVLEIAGLTDYPSYLLTFTGKIEKKLEKNKYIESVDVDREFYHKLVINIKEVEILFRDENSNRYILSSGKKITSNKNIRVPRLINYTPDDKYKKFISNMKEVNKSILGKISEIKYDPNDYDKDRFLLLMDDGNSVFLTLTKFEMINYYNDVLGQLENKKGILYLDSGNHFKIME